MALMSSNLFGPQSNAIKFPTKLNFYFYFWSWSAEMKYKYIIVSLAISLGQPTLFESLPNIYYINLMIKTFFYTFFFICIQPYILYNIFLGKRKVHNMFLSKRKVLLRASYLTSGIGLKDNQ